MNILHPLKTENLLMDDSFNHNNSTFATNSLHHRSYEANAKMLFGNTTKTCSKTGLLTFSEDEPFTDALISFNSMVHQTCGFAFAPCTSPEDAKKIVMAASESVL